MTDTRYYAETPCPECAGTGTCCAHPTCHQCNGSGLSSRVLLTVREVDYEAALNVLIEGDAFAARGFTMTTVRNAIDAALGGSKVLLVEETE